MNKPIRFLEEGLNIYFIRLIVTLKEDMTITFNGLIRAPLYIRFIKQNNTIITFKCLEIS